MTDPPEHLTGSNLTKEHNEAKSATSLPPRGKERAESVKTLRLVTRKARSTVTVVSASRCTSGLTVWTAVYSTAAVYRARCTRSAVVRGTVRGAGYLRWVYGTSLLLCLRSLMALRASQSLLNSLFSREEDPQNSLLARKRTLRTVFKPAINLI